MKKTIFPSLLAAVLACILLTGPVQAAAPASSALERQAGQLVNRQRAARGLPPYVLDPGLSAKARIKSRDMEQKGYFSHASPTYGSPFAMMRSLGISYASAGENIAMGFDRPEAVVGAWMGSEDHRRNLLSNRYTTMGIGYHNGYWTQWLITERTAGSSQ